MPAGFFVTSAKAQQHAHGVDQQGHHIGAAKLPGDGEPGPLGAVISLNRVETAATQGTYSRINTSMEKADRGVKPAMAAATSLPPAMREKP